MYPDKRTYDHATTLSQCTLFSGVFVFFVYLKFIRILMREVVVSFCHQMSSVCYETGMDLSNETAQML